MSAYGAAWQRTVMGCQGSQVQILPYRPVFNFPQIQFNYTFTNFNSILAKNNVAAEICLPLCRHILLNHQGKIKLLNPKIKLLRPRLFLYLILLSKKHEYRQIGYLEKLLSLHCKIHKSVIPKWRKGEKAPTRAFH